MWFFFFFFEIQKGKKLKRMHSSPSIHIQFFYDVRCDKVLLFCAKEFANPCITFISSSYYRQEGSSSMYIVYRLRHEPLRFHRGHFIFKKDSTTNLFSCTQLLSSFHQISIKWHSDIKTTWIGLHLKATEVLVVPSNTCTNALHI